MSGPVSDTRRRYWARRLIDQARDCWPIPRYGSPEWLMLADGSPARIAAVVIAAEAWAQDSDDIEERLRRELVDRWYADKHADDEVYSKEIASHRKRWGHLRLVAVSHSTEVDRVAEARKPRPGDFRGTGAR
jgi:hypothetical protein